MSTITILKGEKKDRNPSNLWTQQLTEYPNLEHDWGGGRGSGRGGHLQTNPTIFGRFVLYSGMHEAILKTILGVAEDWTNEQIYPWGWEPQSFPYEKLDMQIWKVKNRK